MDTVTQHPSPAAGTTTPPPPPAARRALWLWVAVAGVIAVALAWMMWPKSLEVEARAIDLGSVTQSVVDEGRTRIHDVFVLSAPVGGALQRIELEPGDAVTRGQAVAAIAPVDSGLLDARAAAEVNAAVSAARANLAAAQAARDQSTDARDRAKRLFESGHLAQASLDAANSAARTAEAAVQARKAELARAQAAAGFAGKQGRGQAIVRSPANGRILRVLQESETIVPAGASLIEVGDPNDLEVVAEFLSQDAVRMQAGARAWIENWGGDAIPARVSRIEPFAHTKVSALGVEEQRVNVVVRLEAPNAAPQLGHQFRVDVRVALAEREGATRVPTDALVRDGDKWAAFQIDHGRAKLSPVALGPGGLDFYVVEEGLNAGDCVILFPGDTLEDGDRVRATRGDEAGGCRDK
jgi:HlyD family secretion protein